MTGLPLLSLNPNLLEKVVNKLGGRIHSTDKSYFRLQRTCRTVNAFIRSSRNICVSIFWMFSSSWDDDKSCCYLRHNKISQISVEALYGCRVLSIDPYYTGGNTVDEVAKIWDALKRNRITCERLHLPSVVPRSKEQCLTLINAVKPIHVIMQNSGSNRFEALLQTKIPLKEVTITLTLDDVAIVAPQLLPKLQRMMIYLEDSDEPPAAWRSPCDVFRTVLQTLFSGPYPNLHRFYVSMLWGWLPTVEELEREFDGYNLTVGYRDNNCMDFTVQPPEHFPPGSVFTFQLHDEDFAVFEYNVPREQPEYD